MDVLLHTLGLSHQQRVDASAQSLQAGRWHSPRGDEGDRWRVLWKIPPAGPGLSPGWATTGLSTDMEPQGMEKQFLRHSGKQSDFHPEMVGLWH